MGETSVRLGLAGVAVEVSGPDDAIAAIVDETTPFFASPSTEADPVLRIGLSSSPLEHPPPGAGAPVAVDTSLYPHLASGGTRWEVPGGWMVRIDATGSLFHFRPGTGATLHQPEVALAVRDGVRLVKSVLTVAAERSGAVQLHSSAVLTEAGAVLLIGDMWQGKTTLLLELLAEFEVDQLSCDTIVLRTDTDGGGVWGWPSPFSLSHGTLVDHAELAPLLPTEREGVPYATLWREGRKAVLTSKLVVERFGRRLAPSADRVAACLLVRFAPEEPTRVEVMGDEDELRAALRQMYLGSRDPIYHNWHRWLTVDDETIERNIARTAERLLSSGAVYRFVWAPSARSLFKRVPALAPTHPVLRAHRLFEPR